jgi:hypothetical protein
MPSYDLLSELLLKHKSYNYNSFLSELLLIITLTNISNIIRIKQTKHIKDKAETIIKTEVFRKALKTAVALKAITVFINIKTVINITYYLYVKRSVIFITN